MTAENTWASMPKPSQSIAKAPPAATLSEEERLRAFAEIGSDWFWEKDAQLRFCYMSSGIDGQVASFAADFLGKRIDEVRLPGFEEIDWRPLLSALEKRKPFREFHFVRRTAHGSLRHLAVSGVPIFDAQGRFRGYRGTGRDLTKETQAEERAAIAQSRLTDAIESIPECFMLLDKEDRLVLCNSRYRELHEPIAHVLVPGTPFEEICRASAYAELPQAAKGRQEEWVRDRLARHRAPVFAVEERQIGERWFQISEEHTRDGGTVVVQTEITAVKRREQELAEKTALLRATLEHMGQGLLVLDAEFRLKMWNDRWIELLDVPRPLIGVGLPMAPIVRIGAERGEFGPGEIDALTERRIEELRRHDAGILEIYRDTGTVIEVRRSPMPDGGMLFTYADITERKRVEGDLRRAKDEAELASRSKTEFLANMSHELRTPLNAIIGFSDILMGQIFGPLGDTRYGDYARDIRDSGLHLLNLINDVLDVSKVEFGKVELIEETVDVAAVVESCARLMRDRADTAGIRLVQELPPGLPQLQADSRRLKQILLNLLSNAVKFTPSGGRVTIRAGQHATDGFRLTVEDTGIGIAQQDLEKAMRPFGQIDSRLARKYQGTGLGLPLARSMAELHGGKLELDSAPGQGTIATIWLPPSRILRPTPLSHPIAPG
ncbi:MAG TPA: PAS-domain containing protein [Stellaceae bacterium]|nr:PAS-domain containing protein [Stellaceae bacterium]